MTIHNPFNCTFSKILNLNHWSGNIFSRLYTFILHILLFLQNSISIQIYYFNFEIHCSVNSIENKIILVSYHIQDWNIKLCFLTKIRGIPSRPQSVTNNNNECSTIGNTNRYNKSKAYKIKLFLHCEKMRDNIVCMENKTLIFE